MIAAVTIVLGVGMECGGYSIPVGDYTIPGMAASAIVGILLNLILPKVSTQDSAEPEYIEET